jgi:threonyl-tRNA synthetase
MSIPQNSQNYELDVKRHSFAHLMAAAVGQMFPEAQFGVGPVIENGCYYDFVLPRTLIPEDLPLIEKKMKEMLKQPLVFKVQEMELTDAVTMFTKLNQPLKVELLNDLATRGTTAMSEEEKADFEGSEINRQSSANKETPDIKDVDPLKGVRAVYEFKFTENGFTFPANKDLKDRAKDMAKNMTKAEKSVWFDILGSEKTGFKWVKQKVIDNYILDFYCHTLGLVIEIDGDSHAERQEYDKIRTNLLESYGLKVVRFTNQEVYENIAGVSSQLKEIIESRQQELTKNELLESKKVPLERGQSSQNFGGLPKITVYRLENEKTGEDLFVDLCKGPHVEGPEGFSSLRGVGFKLDKFSGSYWRGDQERNIQMQRIYSLVLEDKEELKAFLTNREEAKKRDHRVLGQQLKLFTISDLIGAGLPLLQPNGMKLRQIVENYLWQLHKDKGYDRVWTPHIAKISLYETSGHAAKFGDELFNVQGKDDAFIMKPMNCPHHMQIFDDNQFSYRDMPIRYFEPATVYRDEKTGQLSGLTRVRSITQDDGHLFCRVSQIKQEVSTIVGIIREFYNTLGMQPDWVSLSVRDPNTPDAYLGSDEVWSEAERALEEAAKENNLPYKRVEGEAAFYGPKLDFMFKDALNREWQLSTIQADFNLPERFDLSFVNEDGEDERPVVIHRAISGSLERFLGVMIEHFGGWFPFWLAPQQIKILTVNNEPETMKYVGKIRDMLDSISLEKPLAHNEIRYGVDDRNESLGKKIREATLMKIPVQLIVGPKDIDAGEVSVRTQEGEEKVKLGVLGEYLSGLK